MPYLDSRPHPYFQERQALARDAEQSRQHQADTVASSKDELKALQSTVAQLEEEVRDLRLHQQQASQLAAVGADVADSHIIVTESPEHGGRHRRRHGSRTKR